MSTVRRFFYLFVTFDLLFTSLMWLVCVMMRGETLEQTINTDILQYSVKISLFDIVMVTVCRFVVLLLFYAVLYINNWSVITLPSASFWRSSAQALTPVYLEPQSRADDSPVGTLYDALNTDGDVRFSQARCPKVQPTAPASYEEGLPAHNSSQHHAHKMATEVSAPSMPQLQSVQKAMALPTVGAAVGQVGAFYTKVKGAHSLLEWALSTAEAGVYRAANTAAPYVAAPLVAGDAKVAAALDELERRVPLVTEPPKVIVETTRQAVMSRISPHVNKVYTARAAAEQRVSSLKELSWAKANALLATAYGQKAVSSVDTGAMYAMQLLDHYLPAVGVQEEPSEEIVAVASDPAMHTVQTVGRLSAVAARRVWANLAYKVNELRNSGVELDVRRYLTALLAALHLANVTSQQQQRETEEQEKEKPQAAEPAPPAPASPENTQDSAPTTANQVKATPESKSTETYNN